MSNDNDHIHLPRSTLGQCYILRLEIPSYLSIDLGHREPGRLDAEIQIQRGQLRQHLAQQTVTPACRFGKPVVRDVEGSCLRRCQMLQADNWRLSPAKPLQCLDPAVAGENLVIPVHQDGNVEPKTLNAVGDLPDLPRIVMPRILWIETERSNRKVLDDKFVVPLWRHIWLLPKALVMRWIGGYPHRHVPV